MPRITYVESTGEAHAVDVPVGVSVMEGAVNNLVPGIVADCGGACACATCHVYVEAGWYSRLPPVQELEADMLDFAWEPREDQSRLSCQLTVTPELDGLVVHIPEEQI